MIAGLRWPCRHALLIGTGEGVARSLNLLLLGFLSRRFGVREVGSYALAQGVSLYLLQGTDMGLRHIGARLAAADTGAIAALVGEVQRKRVLLGTVMMFIGYCYGRFGPVPEDARQIVSLYALSIAGYALSLEWLAWGREQFAWLAFWRTSVSLVSLTIVIAAVELLQAQLLSVVWANGIAYLVAAVILWKLWARPLLKRHCSPGSDPALKVKTRWRAAFFLGAGLLANQVLGSADLLLLGGMRNSTEAGLYSAAYRLLLLIVVIYYFFTQAIFPQMAAVAEKQRTLRTLAPSLWKLLVIGIAITAVGELARKPLLLLVYGPAFLPAIAPAGPLLFAIVPDFLSSFLVTALTAWGRSRLVLIGTATAATSNVLMNVVVIPKYGMIGPAYATPISYCMLLAVLSYGIRQGEAPSRRATVGLAKARP